MIEEIKSLKKYISTTSNHIFALFKVENISNLIIYYENQVKENEKLSVELNKNMIERNQFLSKNEKAVELLKKYGNGTFDEHLLNILQGDSND